MFAAGELAMTRRAKIWRAWDNLDDRSDGVLNLPPYVPVLETRRGCANGVSTGIRASASRLRAGRGARQISHTR